MQFIDEHWRKGDALALSRDFFEWSFVRNGDVSIIIGIDESEQKLYGIQGYMPYTDDEFPDCAGTIWKTIRCSDDNMLGLHLADYMHTKIPMRYYAGAGMRDRAMRVAKINGGTVVAMDHYYRLNEHKKISDYKIAVVAEIKTAKYIETNASLNKIKGIDEFKYCIEEKELINCIFKKDYRYIERRYFKHPIYSYDLWRIDNPRNNSSSVLVTRTEQYLGAKACKIVDFFGPADNFSYIGKTTELLMDKEDYEYIDVYSYGFETSYYEQSGFVRCDVNSINIIPNYFQPFEQRNVQIFLEKPWFEGLVLFRGDGDQDRPVQCS